MPTNHTELTLGQLDTVTGGLVNDAVAGAIKGAIWGGISAKDVDGPATLPPDWVESICHIIVG
jgi:hypothetical protein